MKNRRCLMEGLALALAGILLLAGLALAQQNQGKNPGVCPAGNQVCTGGPGGTCTVNPAQKGKQNCPGAGKAQKRQGMKSGQAGQPTTPANPPATNE